MYKAGDKITLFARFTDEKGNSLTGLTVEVDIYAYDYDAETGSSSGPFPTVEHDFGIYSYTLTSDATKRMGYTGRFVDTGNVAYITELVAYAETGVPVTEDILNTPAAVWSESTRGLTEAVEASNMLSASDVWGHADRGLTEAVEASNMLTADNVWQAKGRELTDYKEAAIAVAVWNALNRTLTSAVDTKDNLIAKAVWEYTTRTLTDQGGTPPPAADVDAIAERVWNWMKRTLTEMPSGAYSGDVGTTTLQIRQAVNYDKRIGSSVSLTGVLKVYWTVKAKYDDLDEEAVLQVELDEGLITLNGSQEVWSAGGSIKLISDQEIALALLPQITKELKPAKYYVWDLKGIYPDGTNFYISGGRLYVLPSVTQAWNAASPKEGQDGKEEVFLSTF